jgi:hypothetical protein
MNKPMIDVMVVHSGGMAEVSSMLNEFEKKNARRPTMIRLWPDAETQILLELGYGKKLPERLFGIPVTTGGQG